MDPRPHASNANKEAREESLPANTAQPSPAHVLLQVIGPIFGILPLLFAGFKILVAANGNDAALGALLVTLDVKAILLATFLPQFASLLTIASGIYIVFRFEPLADVETVLARRRSGLMLLPFILMASLLTPANPYDLVLQTICIGTFCALSFIPMSALLSLAESLAPPMRIRHWDLGVAYLKIVSYAKQSFRIIAIAFAFYSLAPTALSSPTTSMWLPASLIELKGRSNTYVGWILSDDNDTTTILFYGPVVARYPSTEVDKVRICSIPRYLNRRPLISVLMGQRAARQLPCNSR
jgi:hypothetical protein